MENQKVLIVKPSSKFFGILESYTPYGTLYKGVQLGVGDRVVRVCEEAEDYHVRKLELGVVYKVAEETVRVPSGRILYLEPIADIPYPYKQSPVLHSVDVFENPQP